MLIKGLSSHSVTLKALVGGDTGNSGNVEGVILDRLDRHIGDASVPVFLVLVLRVVESHICLVTSAFSEQDHSFRSIFNSGIENTSSCHGSSSSSRVSGGNYISS